MKQEKEIDKVSFGLTGNTANSWSSAFENTFLKCSLCKLLQWFALEGVPYGEVHLKLQWLSLITDPSLLTEVNLFLEIRKTNKCGYFGSKLTTLYS